MASLKESAHSVIVVVEVTSWQIMVTDIPVETVDIPSSRKKRKNNQLFQPQISETLNFGCIVSVVDEPVAKQG